MSSEENKKIEELLKKLEEFTEIRKLPLFQNKPQYVDAVEREIEKSELDPNEYTKIPFNPVTDVFSELVLFYWLTEDGIFEKYPDVFVGKFDFNFSCAHSATYVPIIRISPPYELALINIKKPYIYMVRVANYVALIDFFSVAFNTITRSIKGLFNINEISRLCNDSGIFMLLSATGKGINDEDKVASKLKGLPWSTESVEIWVDNAKQKFLLSIYYRKKDNDIWVYVPAHEIEDFFDYTITNYFRLKEKKK